MINSKIFSKLAQNMFSKTCANIIEFVQKIIFPQDFIERNRNQKSDFTRNRKPPLSTLILYPMYFRNSAIAYALSFIGHELHS